MKLSLPHEIRDPIHGLIRLTDQELRIVNTPTFQRLRRIRQLAMADLVYPGAVHTRFEHSLGVLNVAHRILERLDNIEQLFYNDVNDAITVRLAALLHDVGHGPFSHVSEHLLELYADRSAAGAGSREKIHERITLDIIRHDPQIAALLTAEQQDSVQKILRGTGSRDYRRDIVSSSLDADKMDYLLRDAHYAGVRYGQYDLDKIVDSFRRFPNGRESYLMIRWDAIFAVEQLILSKHHMIQQVYGHRVRTVTDTMIVRGLELAIKADESVRAVYAFDGSDKHLRQYLSADDTVISARVLARPDEHARDIFQRLRDRRLYKEVALIRINEAEVPDALVRDHLLKLSRDERTELEEAIAIEIGCDPWEVIVYRGSVKNPAYWAPGGLDPETIFVISREGIPKKLSQYEELDVARLPTTEWLHVIARWDRIIGSEESDRIRIKRDLEEKLRSLVIEKAGGSL